MKTFLVLLSNQQPVSLNQL